MILERKVGDAQNDLSRWPQPNTVVIANQQNYRIDFTGDITDSRFFENGDVEFSIFEAQGTDGAGTGARGPVHCGDGGDDDCALDDWAVIVNFKFLKSSKVLFYHNNLKVDGASRLSQVSLAQPAGYGYVHPTTKVTSNKLMHYSFVLVWGVRVSTLPLAGQF